MMAPKEGADGNTGEKQRRHRNTSAGDGNPVNEECGPHRAQECEERQREKEQAAKSQCYGQDGSSRAAGRYADDSRIGHRIAKKTLHRRAGDAQGRSHQCGDDDSGQAQLLDYQLLGAGIRGKLQPKRREHD